MFNILGEERNIFNILGKKEGEYIIIKLLTQLFSHPHRLRSAINE